MSVVAFGEVMLRLSPLDYHQGYVNSKVTFQPGQKMSRELIIEKIKKNC